MQAAHNTLSRMIGLLGILLPFILVVAGMNATPSIEWQPAISDYYHTCVGYLFVIGMLAIGAFLICYRSEMNKEDIVTDIAGGLAMLVALFPTDGGTSVIGHVHWISAVLFILATAYISYSIFASEDTNGKRLHQWCGCIIFLCVVLLIVNNNVSTWPDRTVWWLETIAVFAFGLAWMRRSTIASENPVQHNSPSLAIARNIQENENENDGRAVD